MATGRWSLWTVAWTACSVASTLSSLRVDDGHGPGTLARRHISWALMTFDIYFSPVVIFCIMHYGSLWPVHWISSIRSHEMHWKHQFGACIGHPGPKFNRLSPIHEIQNSSNISLSSNTECEWFFPWSWRLVVLLWWWSHPHWSSRWFRARRECDFTAKQRKRLKWDDQESLVIIDYEWW